MTLSLAAVFIPIVFLGGILGRLLSEFAVTIGAAILVSGFVSLTLTPMMCGRLLRSSREVRRGRMYAATEKLFDASLWTYEAALRWVLRRPRTTMIVSVAVLLATVKLYIDIPKGFLPSEDTGRIFTQTEAAEGISFESMMAHQQALAAIVRSDPRVASFSSSIGMRGGSAAGANTGTLFLRLKPRTERAESADEIIQDLRPKLAQVPGIRVFMQNVAPIRLGGRLTKSQYQYTLQGPDTDELYRYAPLLADRMAELPGFQDVTTDVQLRSPQINIEIDRDRIAAMGITPEQIELGLGSAYASRQISTIYGANNQYKVILAVEPRFQMDPTVVPLLHIRSSNGQLVPLDAIARVTRGVGPMSVNHQGQLPAVTISFNLKPEYSLGPAVQEVEQLAQRVVPPTISGSFQGTAQVFQSSQQGLELLVIVSVLVIYLVLGILYESYLHPITILTALPFAEFGALLTLRVFHVDLSLYAFVGVIMLIGLVKKNGIMMIDFALEAQRHRRLAPAEAIYEACVVRFRPIMMTTMAALMGTLPIALGWGAGSESRRPLGLAVVGGLLFSQSLTLFVTPVFYLSVERLRGLAFRRSRTTASLAHEHVEESTPAGATVTAPISTAEPAWARSGSP